MLLSFLKIALRTLRREKGYAFINVAGLAIGIACSMMILLFVIHELSFDRHIPDVERIHRVRLAGDEGNVASMPTDAAQRLQEQFPEIVGSAYIRLSDAERLVHAHGKELYETRFAEAYVESSDLLGLETIEGGFMQALRDPGAVVLTRSAARRYFGSESPIGAPLVIRNEERGEVVESVRYPMGGGSSIAVNTYEWEDVTYTVGAVIEDLPAASTLQFDFLLSGRELSWGGYSLILLRPGTSPESLQAKLDGVDIGPYISGFAPRLQPFTDAHFSPDWPIETSGMGREGYLYILTVVAVALLLVACINYVNLATARAARRAREVGQRKVVGATRGQLVMQFLGESTLTTLLAVGLGLLIAQSALPLLNAALGTKLTVSTLAQPDVAVVVFAIAVFVSLMSGAIPAVALSSMSIIQVLKGYPIRRMSGMTLRKGLVVFQFSASVVLLLTTVIAYQQMEFVRSSRLNVRGDEVLVVSNGKEGIRGGYDAFRQALMNSQWIQRVGLGAPPGGPTAGVRTELDPSGTHRFVGFSFVDRHYFDVLGIEFTEGGGFGMPGEQPDSSVVINETLARLVGRDDIVGSSLEGITPATVVGIVRDYHNQPLREQISPVVLQHAPEDKRSILVRLRSGGISDGLAHVQDVWSRFVPDQPLKYRFLDDQLDEAYRTELRMSGLLGAFAGLTLVVALLGLFGLAAYTSQQRTKEIGIRKVLGATVSDLVALLSRDYLRLVVVAFILGAPVAFLLMRRWLDEFAYRVDITGLTFVAVGVAAVSIALTTVSLQAVRAALADPVQSLRSE